MKLLTKEIISRTPRVYAQRDSKDPVVYARFFFPMGRWTYYMTELDPDGSCFGYCISPLGEDCDEWAHSSVSEFESIRLGGLGVERDRSFTPRPFSECVPGKVFCY